MKNEGTSSVSSDQASIMNETHFYARCASCETVFEVTDPSLIGKIVDCPRCGGMILIEDPDAIRSANEARLEPEPATVTPENDAPLNAPQKEPRGVSQDASIVQSSIESNARVSVEAPPQINNRANSSSSDEPDEQADAESRVVWRSRLLLALSGGVCALAIILVLQLLCSPTNKNANAPDASQGNVFEIADDENPDGDSIDQTSNADDVENAVDEDVESVDEEEENEFASLTRDDDFSSENFDASAVDDLNEDVSAEGANEERVVPDENDAALARIEEDESTDANNDGIESESEELTFNEDEFDEANRNNSQEEEDDSDIEEDFGAIASTTDVARESSLPILKATPKSAKINVEERLSLEIESITFPESPAAAVRLLAEFSGVPIDFDLDNYVLARESLNASLDLTLEKTNVGDALHALAELLKWNITVGDEQIIIEPASADDALIEEKFDVADLVEATSDRALFEFIPVRNENSNELTVETIRRAVLTLVDPESWEENGGKGTLEIDGTKLVTRQTAANRKRAHELLDRLRALRGLVPTGEEKTSSLISENLGWDRLRKKISFNLLNPIKLQQAIEILERTQKLGVLWDDGALNEYGTGRESTVSALIDDATIERTLGDLLDPLRLTFIALDENLFLITTKERAENYKTVELHLFASDSSKITEEEAKNLALEMQTAVAPKSWNEPGASIWIDLQSGCWIVRQSQPTQRAIRRWLAERE